MKYVDSTKSLVVWLNPGFDDTYLKIFMSPMVLRGKK